MRTFNFKARNIGDEKYLTYTMGEDCDLNEDILDYCEENEIKELIKIIYEEDDDYDYLTFDISNRCSLEDYSDGYMTCTQVLNLLRNISNSLIQIKEQNIHLSYILLNRKFIYVDNETLDVCFICLPVEMKTSVMFEFTSFVRQFLANLRYDIDDDLNYIGKLLTYINSGSFNLKGLISLTEALMEDEGIMYEESSTIDENGVEVVDDQDINLESESEQERRVDIMDGLDNLEDDLPEIGDDEDDYDEVDDDGLDSILPPGMKALDGNNSDVSGVAGDTEELTDEMPELMPEIAAISMPEFKEEVSEIIPDAVATTSEHNDGVMQETNVSSESDIAEETSELPDDEMPDLMSEIAMGGIPSIQPVKSEPIADATENKETGMTEEFKSEPVKKSVSDSKPAKNSFKINDSFDDDMFGTIGFESIDSIPFVKTASKPSKEEETGKVTPATKVEKNQDIIKQRIRSLVGVDEDYKDEYKEQQNNTKKKVVKVNRAALIQSLAEHENETMDEDEPQEGADAVEVAVAEDKVKTIPITEGNDEAEGTREDSSRMDDIKKVAAKTASILGRKITSPVVSINTPKINPYIVRVNTNERIMITKNIFKLGKATRGVDYTIGGNGAISRQHAFIIQKDGVCYIKDNKSTNHTYINDNQIEDGAEEILTHDSRIKLGDEEFIFKLR